MFSTAQTFIVLKELAKLGGVRGAYSVEGLQALIVW